MQWRVRVVLTEVTHHPFTHLALYPVEENHLGSRISFCLGGPLLSQEVEWWSGSQEVVEYLLLLFRVFPVFHLQFCLVLHEKFLWITTIYARKRNCACFHMLWLIKLILISKFAHLNLILEIFFSKPIVMMGFKWRGYGDIFKWLWCKAPRKFIIFLMENE